MNASKKGRGRPPKGSGVAKSTGVLLRLQPAEKESFASAAELAGVPVAAWMRERLRQSARRELEGADRVVPFLAKRSQ
jgi:hypothetical protein